MADKLKQLPIYTKAVNFCGAITAILDRPAFRDDDDLRRQIDEANDSITANMEEGFERSSDAELARFLHFSKGSVAEILDRLRSARRKQYVTEHELDRLVDDGDELERMLAGWIRYLARTDFKDRGRHRAKPAVQKPSQKSRRSSKPQR